MHPARPPVATCRVRRPSASIGRLRTSSFSSSSTSQPAAPIRVRASTVSSQHRPSIHVKVVSNCPRSRSRSTWGFRPRRYLGSRFTSTFHSHQCSWIRSSGNPHAIPRDKDCPACQEAEKRPEEVSPQELWWERRMHRFKEAVDKDPYDAIFGWSNDLLKGRSGARRQFWHDMEALAGKGARDRFLFDDAFENRKKSMLEDMFGQGKVFDRHTEKAADHESVKSDAKIPPQPDSTATASPATTQKTESASQDIPVKTAPPKPMTSQSSMSAYSQWSYQSTDNAGKTTSASGSSVYDPISGRMVPVSISEQKIDISAKIEAPAKVEAPSAEISQMVKVSSPAARAVATEKASNRDNEKPSSTTTGSTISPPLIDTFLGKLPEKAANPGKAGLNHVENQLGIMQQQVQSLVTAQRAKLYREVESSLVVAKDSVKAMIATEQGRTQLLARSENLRDSSLGKTLLCIRNTQLSLQSYKHAAISIMVPPEIAAATGIVNDDGISKKCKLEASWRSDGRRPVTTDAAHFRQTCSKYPLKDYKADPIARQAYESLHRHRNAPLKQMSAHELSNHRTLLLRSWVKHHPRPEPPVSEATKRLNCEVAAQKSLYAAWENRWSRKGKSSDATPTASLETTPSPLIATSGEGDMCPNVAKYSNADRMYKRKAPHAMVEDNAAVASHVVDMKRTPKVEPTNTVNRHLRTALERHAAMIKAATSKPATVKPATRVSLKVPTTDIQPEQATTTSSPTSPLPPWPSPFYIAHYDEAQQSLAGITAYAHPDGWSTPRISPGTIMENLRTKAGYNATVLPFIEQMRASNYVLYDLARDDSIIFRLKPVATTSNSIDISLKRPATSTPAPKQAIAPSVASRPKMTTELSSKARINPVDPSLRPTPPQTQTGNFASPTGFVNLDTPEDVSRDKTNDINRKLAQPTHSKQTKENHYSQQRLSKSKQRKVRKQEHVYSGGRHGGKSGRNSRPKVSVGEAVGSLVILIMVGSVGYFIYRTTSKSSGTAKRSENGSKKEQAGEKLASIEASARRAVEGLNQALWDGSTVQAENPVIMKHTDPHADFAAKKLQEEARLRLAAIKLRAEASEMQEVRDAIVKRVINGEPGAWAEYTAHLDKLDKLREKEERATVVITEAEKAKVEASKLGLSLEEKAIDALTAMQAPVAERADTLSSPAQEPSKVARARGKRLGSRSSSTGDEAFEAKQRIAAALAEVTTTSLILGTMAWVFLKMWEKN